MTLAEALTTLFSQKKLTPGTPFRRAEFIELLVEIGLTGEDKNQELFLALRNLAEGDSPNIQLDSGSYKISYSGTRRGRNYWISPGVQGPGTVTGAPGHQTPTVGATINDPQQGNDNIEDWEHITAHLAMMLINRSINVSLGKISQRKKEKYSNPDLIGISIRQETEQTLKYISGEVKPFLNSRNDLLEAVFETAHNGRFFHESWLLLPLAEELIENARELGQQYNIGVIGWDQGYSARPFVLSIPTPRKDSKFASFIANSVESLRNKFSDANMVILKQKAGKLADSKCVYLDILRAFTTDQINDSIIPNLPERVMDSLKGSTDVNLLSRFSDVITSLIKEAFDNDSSVDETLTAFVQKNLVTPLNQNAGPTRLYSTALHNLILNNYRQEIEEHSQEVQELKEYLKNLPQK